MMSDIPAKRLFRTLDQLKGELFPLVPTPPDENPAKDGEIDEAEILANKLIEGLINPAKGSPGDEADD